jgi:hypothetical protein
MRIYFDKLLNGHYSIDVEMEMINWFLKTGNKYDEYTGKWNKDGVSKQIFDYSANSHSANFPFPIVCENFIGNASFSFNVLKGFLQNCLYNAILKEPTSPVKKWRNDENIEAGKYRVIQLNTDYPEVKHSKFENTYWALQNLKKFIGMPLNKEFFNSDYKERINPKIINIIFYTNGNGYVFEYVFSFSNFDYEPGWSNHICQKENESIPCFLNRIYFEMDSMLDVV